MKVFMSWSGQRSHAVAEVLAWWVKCVLQAARPWISSEDLDRGSLWFSEINNSLSDTSVGIVCLTDENKDRPWVLFEAGALAKGLSNSRVCTFLIDLKPSDITDPLAQFNHTMKSQDDMKKLARTLNAALGANALDTNLLNDICDVYWPKFDEKFEKALKAFPPASPKVARPESDVLSDILEAVRGMNQRIRQLESPESIPPWERPGYQKELEALQFARAKDKFRAMSVGGSTTEEIAAMLGSEGLTSNIVRELFHSLVPKELNALEKAARASTKKQG